MLNLNYFRNPLFYGTTEDYLKYSAHSVKAHAKAKFNCKNSEVTSDLVLDYINKHGSKRRMNKKQQKLVEFYETQIECDLRMKY